MDNLGPQFLQEELKRTIDWIKFADQKTACLAVYYSAILGFLISQKNMILNAMSLTNSLNSIFLYAILFFIISIFTFGIYFLFSSIFPSLKNSFTDESLFYFGTISKMKFIDFTKKMNDLSGVEAKKQLAEQIYTNSLIADQKMKSVKSCIKCLFILVFFTAVLILMY